MIEKGVRLLYYLPSFYLITPSTLYSLINFFIKPSLPWVMLRPKRLIKLSVVSKKSLYIKRNGIYIQAQRLV